MSISMRKMKEMPKGTNPLEVQVDSFFRHTRINSRGTRQKYHIYARDFARWASNNTGLQNIKNVKPEHISGWLNSKDIRPATKRNYLSAMRFVHELTPKTRYYLPENEKFQEKFGVNLDYVPKVKGNHGWTQTEIDRALDLAREQGNTDISKAIRLAYGLGLRRREIVSMERWQAEAGIREGSYPVGREAKNGRPREVPTGDIYQKEVLKSAIDGVERGEKVFDQDLTSRQLGDRFYNWIYDNRHLIETPEGREMRAWTDRNGQEHQNQLTLHGLRHTYAKEQYREYIAEGRSESEAKRLVSENLGHSREDITETYLAGI